MFGMLDYRAHKLFLILFGIPLIILNLISIFGLSFCAYLIGFNFAETWLVKIIFSIVTVIIIEIVWTLLIFLIINKLVEFIFGLFIDVIPAEGRTKEEAQIVVYRGEKARNIFKLNQHPKEWTDELMEAFAKSDWVANLFYYDTIINRMKQVKEHFEMNPELTFEEWNVTDYINSQEHLVMSWQEKTFSNPIFRRVIIVYSIFLLIILVNPLSI